LSSTTAAPRRRALAALLLAAPLAGCSLLGLVASGNFKRPTLSYVSWAPEAFDLEGVTLALQYRVDNPNDASIPVGRIAYALEAEGSRVVSGELPHGVTLAARASTPLAFPIRLRFRDVPNLLQLLGRDTIAYRVSGAVGIDTPVGDIEMPFEHGDRVALPRLPGIALDGVSIRDAGLSGLSLDVKLRVANSNGFPLPTGALQGALRVAGSQVATLSGEKLAAVPARGSSLVTLPVHVSLAGAGTAVLEALGGSGADVRLLGRADYGPLEVPLDLAARARR